MCPNTCVAYTRPYEELDTCSWCPLSRYIPDTNTSRKQFTTVPIGPVIQAFYGSREIASHMHYLERSLSVNSDRVTIRVWACPDRLLTGYDYGTKVCHSVLVMDSCISQR